MKDFTLFVFFAVLSCALAHEVSLTYTVAEFDGTACRNATNITLTGGEDGHCLASLESDRSYLVEETDDHKVKGESILLTLIFLY